MEKRNKYYAPKNKHPINEVYVALSKDSDKTESIMGFYIQGDAVPMVFGDKEVLEKYYPVLQHAVLETGKEINIYRFTKCEEIIKKFSGN